MRYIVLRDLRRTRVSDPFSGGADVFGAPPSAASPAEPSIEVEDLDVAARKELARDPSVVAITRPMPVQLIRPIADDGAPALDPDPNDPTAPADPPPAPPAPAPVPPAPPPAGAPGDAWGIEAVGADRSAFTGTGSIVAVLDTGIDATHPAFAGVTLVEQDFSGTGNGDRAGHGTHCAGTIFGRDVDGARIGVARGVTRALIGKVLDDQGNGSSENVLRGMQWAAEQGVDVISMSIGFDFPGVVRQWVDEGWPVELATAVALESYRGNVRMFDAMMAMLRAQEVLAPGTVVVAAAGNESRRSQDPQWEIAASVPAAAEGILSVAAVSKQPRGWTIWPFSNTFPKITAPGVAIKSAAIGGGTREMTGTSMACPHVAGVAALWWDFAREQGLPPRATSVIAKTLGTARIEGFANPTDIADRGVGMVTAP